MRAFNSLIFCCCFLAIVHSNNDFLFFIFFYKRLFCFFFFVVATKQFVSLLDYTISIDYYLFTFPLSILALVFVFHCVILFLSSLCGTRTTRNIKSSWIFISVTAHAHTLFSSGELFLFLANSCIICCISLVVFFFKKGRGDQSLSQQSYKFYNFCSHPSSSSHAVKSNRKQKKFAVISSNRVPVLCVFFVQCVAPAIHPSHFAN